MVDDVERDYLRSVLDEDPPPAASAAAGPGGGPPIAGFVPTSPFALHGCVLTPDTVIEKGWVDVHGGTITRVGKGVPGPGIQRIETDGVILPGLIDLHGHPEYNVFAAWEPPKLFANRGRWRALDEYDVLVKQPLATLTGHHRASQTTLIRYAEARALVGGTTAIQGANGTFATSRSRSSATSTGWIFGAHRARSIIDLDRDAAGGRRDAPRPDRERRRQRRVRPPRRGRRRRPRAASSRPSRLRDLLTPATVIIHGTALEPADLDEVAASGREARVVAAEQPAPVRRRRHRAGAARHAASRSALGADWLPSGSPSLLAEMKVARQALIEEGRPATARQLVRMVTATRRGSRGSRTTSACSRPDGLPTCSCSSAATPIRGRRSCTPPAGVELVVLGRRPGLRSADWVRGLAGVSAGDRIPPVRSA